MSQIKCRFSVYDLVYDNYKLISESAFGRGSREFRFLRILKLLRTYLKDRKNLHFSGIPV